jgi:predicted transcriptional regulator
MNHKDFKAWRAQHKLDQREAAGLLRCSLSTVAAYETPPRQRAKHRKVPAQVQLLIALLGRRPRATVARVNGR